MKITKIIPYLLMVLCLVGCSQQRQQKVLRSEADLSGLRVGVSTGTAHDLRLSSRTDLELHKFNSASDALLSLTKGKIDVFVEDDSSIPLCEMKRIGVRVAFYGDEVFPCGFPMRKDEKGLCDSLSHFIDSLIATGEMQEIHDRWFLSEDPTKSVMPDLPPKPAGKPIRVGSAIEMPPVSYHVGGVWLGFEPELMERFSRYAGRPVVIEYYPFASCPSALSSGKIDMFLGGVFITKERRETMDFPSSHFNSRAAYFVKDESSAVNAGFGTRLKKMVENNLLVENRWRYITDGLWETVKISVLSILSGTLFGAIICRLRMSQRKWVSRAAEAYINIMRGIPMLVFLMIMFYVIFAQAGVSGTFVAVVSFALIFAAYVSEMFRTAITAVGKGQTEAGLALGLTKWQTFIHIVAPQAVKNVMPVYKGEAISLLKSTSIVGYIAIQDLTRASDIIRSRTFDALFPLLIITFIYFILSWILGKSLDLITRSTQHKVINTK